MFQSLTARRIILFILLLTLPVSSCRKKDRFIFPYVHIDIYALLTDLDANIGPGEAKDYYDNAGLNGLIIYRSLYDGYFVFDRSCTYEPDFTCAVESTSFSGVVECPCCGSQYLIDVDDAYVLNGPARYPLVQYKAIIDGGFLHIYN